MSMEYSDRSAYIGVHLRPAVKDALVRLVDAAPEPLSVSRLVSDWIEQKLIALGVDLREPVDPRHLRLPFDDGVARP